VFEGSPSRRFIGVWLSLAIVGGNYGNGAGDGAFAMNLNNTASNANANIGGSYSLIIIKISNENLIPYHLVKISRTRGRISKLILKV